MNNKLIKKEDESLFCKIKAFIFKLLNKKNRAYIQEESKDEVTEKYNEFVDNIKVESSNNKLNKQIEINKFINNVEKNPQIIENLSDERLDRLTEYYEKIIDEKKKKICKLKMLLN